jgi:hypothetical protein
MMACNDAAAPLLKPELAPAAARGAAPARVTLCHLNGQGDFERSIVPLPAVRGQLAQGGSGLVGDRAGG